MIGIHCDHSFVYLVSRSVDDNLPEDCNDGGPLSQRNDPPSFYNGTRKAISVTIQVRFLSGYTAGLVFVDCDMLYNTYTTYNAHFYY